MSIWACVAFGYVGVLGGFLETGALLCVALIAMQSAVVRNALDRHAAFQDRVRRQQHRHSGLGNVTPERRQQYVELLTLVAQIERSDPAEAARCELEQLLDYFVQLSCAQQRFLESLHMSAATIASEAAGATRRDEIVARRVHHRDESSARLTRVVDEIDATDELIRLVAQRVAYASLESLIDLEVDRRLTDLDNYDAALHQLSA